jgi:hypothetical protein
MAIVAMTVANDERRSRQACATSGHLVYLNGPTRNSRSCHRAMAAAVVTAYSMVQVQFSVQAVVPIF